MMMVQQDFKDRIIEVEAYFNFMQNIDNGTIHLTTSNLQIPSYSSNDRENILRTLKASAFLMLYNLMESTVSNAVEAIFIELSSKNVSFDACRNSLRIIILNNLRQHKPAEIIPFLKRIEVDVIFKTFRKDEIVSGNVDARKIRKFATEYGFHSPAVKGNHLLTVKSKRNDLAHGTKSFMEVGRDYPMNEMLDIKNQVIAYLQTMLNNIETYLLDKDYLNKAP